MNMDVISPQLLWIEGRCYRVNQTSNEPREKPPQNTPYVEEDLYDDDGTEEEDEFEIVVENDKYKTSYHVPQAFFPQIIGSKGTTKKRIEAETKTQIKVPKPGVEGDIVIVGSSRQSIVAARRKINLIVVSARDRQQFTHFLCVPCTESSIKDNYKVFKNEILSGPEIPGLEESLFQNPNKLHLTIATLSLMDNEDRILAAQTLYECKELVIDPIVQEYGPLDLHLCGLEYMNDDPSLVDVLYAKVDSEPMQLIANGIADRFAEKGLTQKKTETVKMHMTLINSRLRGDEDDKNRQTFDARKIIETYNNYNFGVQRLSEIHLSQRYSTSCDGFYEATGTLKL